MENLEGLSKKCGIVGMGTVDVEDSTGRGDFRMRLDSNRSDYGECAGTATLECPEEVGVLLCVGRDIFALRGDSIEGEDVVGAHTIDTRQWTVTSALNVTTGPAYSLIKVSFTLSRKV